MSIYTFTFLRIEPLSNFASFCLKLTENNDTEFLRILLKVAIGLQLSLYLRPMFKYLKGLDHFGDRILNLILKI